MALMFILTIVLLVALVGSLPTWPHSKKWGYFPIGVMSVVIVIVLMLFATGHLRAR
jgi:bacteriorhodopsin